MRNWTSMDSSPQHQWLPPAHANPPVPWQAATPAHTPPAPPPFVEQRPPAWKRYAGPLLLAGALFLKFGKFILVALKGAKFLTTSASMLVSVAAYAFIFGWPFAVGFVALLFVHEMGHYIQLRREGIETSPIVFVPFLGAAISMKSMPEDATAEARVGLAGPILGSAAVGCAGLATGSEFLQALGYVGLFLNLINLVPVLPLDGGRAMAAMAPWMWFVGYFAVIVALFVWFSPILLLVALFGGIETYRRWKTRKSSDSERAYYRVTPRNRVLVGAVYFALIALLALGMDLTYLERDFSDV
jgi:Zn-dependent protease